MKMKSQIKFGTYSNDGLGTGLSFIELSDEELAEMDNIILEDLQKIERDFIENLFRLDDYIKKNIGAIPKKEEFVKWFFDKKKITAWGKNIPLITESEIFENAKVYVQELDCILKPKSKREKAKVLSKNNESINYEFLYKCLKEYIFKDNSESEIKELFESKNDISNIKFTLQISNKAFIFLLEELIEIYAIHYEYASIIESKKCVLSKKGTLIKANNLHQAKDQFGTGFGNENEQKTIQSIIKNIKNIKST